MLVGPDNGLLWPAIERLGGARRGGRRLALAVPAGAGLGDLPRPRRVRAGRRASGPRRVASPRRARRSTPARWSASRCRSRRSRRIACVAHVVSRRPVRQRGPRPRRPPRCPRPGCAWAGTLTSRPRGRGARRRLRAHLRRRRRRRADPLRGLQPEASRWRSTAAARPRDSASTRATEVDPAPGVTCVRQAPPPPAGSPTRPTSAPGSSRRRGRPRGTVVTADEQTAGRGRRGPHLDRARRQGAPLLGDPAPARRAPPAAAARGPARRLRGGRGAGARLECRVKWPNDVWVDEPQARRRPDRGRPQDGWAVIGVGLNLSIDARRVPGRPAQTATSLGRRRRRRDRRSRRALRAPRRAGWTPTERLCSSEFARARRAARRAIALGGREVAWDGAQASPTESTSAATWSSSPRAASGSASAPARSSLTTESPASAPSTRPSGASALRPIRRLRRCGCLARRSALPPFLLGAPWPASSRLPPLRLRRGACRLWGSCAAARGRPPRACGPSACGRRAAPPRPPGVWATAAASSATARRRSCLRAAWTSRRALRPWARPEELTSRPSRRLVSGQRCTAYSSCSSRV